MNNRAKVMKVLQKEDDFVAFDLLLEATKIERKAMHNVINQMASSLFVTRDKMDGKTFYKVTALGRAWKPDTDKRRQRAFNNGAQPKIDLVSKAN